MAAIQWSHSAFHISGENYTSSGKGCSCKCKEFRSRSRNLRAKEVKARADWLDSGIVQRLLWPLMMQLVAKRVTMRQLGIHTGYGFRQVHIKAQKMKSMLSTSVNLHKTERSIDHSASLSGQDTFTRF